MHRWVKMYRQVGGVWRSPGGPIEKLAGGGATSSPPVRNVWDDIAAFRFLVFTSVLHRVYYRPGSGDNGKYWPWV